MLTQLRKTAQRPATLVDLLLACHGKIRHFTEVARAAGELVAPPAALVEACDSAHRYFAEALPLHVADEEQSLLPRLVGRDPALDQALFAMQAEHEAHAAGITALLAALRSVACAPEDGALRRALACAALQTAALFAPHLQAEEQHVFPALHRLLSEAEQQAVIGELRARRSRMTAR